MTGRWVWWIGLSLAAAEDLRKRKISSGLLVLVLFAGALRLLAMMAGGADVTGHLWASLVGISMLVLSAVTEGAIGEGDGLFFLLTACFLELWELIALFAASLAVSCLWGICLILSGLREGRSRWRSSIPFLTCAWLPGLYIILRG